MKRNINSALQAWKAKQDHQVLLLRGARQTGKTYSIRELGKSFEYFLEVNFEERPDLCTLFNSALSPLPICEKLSAALNMPIRPGRTLLFFDEIQSCPNCLRSLRFFYEEMPDLHVAAAGSMLEFALAEIPSFGVGRIESFYLYPMSFSEFCSASDGEKLWETVTHASVGSPIDPVLHQMLLDRLRTYLVIGGMPKAVSTYCSTHDLLRCQDIIDNLIATIKDDFAKYKRRSPVSWLSETLLSVSRQAGGKFIYSRVSREGKTFLIKQSLDLLEKAGLVYKVCHTSAQGVPLGAQTNPDRFKAVIFDVGIHQRLLNLDLSQHVLQPVVDLVNKGSLAEVFAGLELLSSTRPNTRPNLFYWHREAHASNAEIDYILYRGGRIYPIEVKAGTRGTMQSLHLFLKERNYSKGIRLSQENFGTYNNIVTIPLYAASLLRDEGFMIPE